MFAVIATNAIPEHLHGYLSRFLTEASAGLYVGNVSPVVVENLWGRIEQVLDTGSVTLVYSDHSREQGYSIRTAGPATNGVFDMDGMILVASRPGRAVEMARIRQ